MFAMAEDIVEKEENADKQYLLLLRQCFQKVSSYDLLKHSIVS